ncbi:MAG: indole-3-glycerol phosphate synthase TrpC [Planctomycetota bacterium]|jgi:indole-3-glycerol phosphate synthase
MNKKLPNILSKIKETKLSEIEVLNESFVGVDYLELAEKSIQTDPPLNFHKAVTSKSPAINLIAEVKKASPSKGLIRSDFNPAEIAAAYEAGGAAAISCLTDQTYFQGNIEYIKAIKKKCSIPVLRKDFIISAIQVAEARLNSADAILLISRMLKKEELEDLICLSGKLGMSVLCEIHDTEDLDKALHAGAELIGINNRDLDTFTVDKQLCLKLKKSLPENIPVVAESGIFTAADMKVLSDNDFCAALVGESLMRQHDIKNAVKQLLDFT